MTRAILVLGLLSGGCLVVPAKKVTSRPAPNEVGAATFATARSVELTAQADAGSVRVHAISHGECSSKVFAVTEVTTERKAKLGGSDDPRAALFGLVLAPVLIPISALVTGFMLAGDEPVTTRQVRPIGIKRFACSREAEQLAIQMTLPSGAVVEAVTDTNGDALFEVPATEPYQGSVRLAAQTAETKQLAYALPRPAVTVLRDAMTECATKHKISGAIELKASINSSGHPTRLWLSVGDAELNQCVSQRVAGQRFPQKMWDHTIKLPLTISTPGAASL